MFLQLCPVVPVGAGVPGVTRLDQLQVSDRAVLEETKQLFVLQHEVEANAMLPSVQAAAPCLFSVYRDPLGTPGAGDSQGTRLPAALRSVLGQRPCPAAGGEQRQRDLPFHSHHAGKERPSGGQVPLLLLWKNAPLPPLQGAACNCRLCDQALFSFAAKIGRAL